MKKRIKLYRMNPQSYSLLGYENLIKVSDTKKYLVQIVRLKLSPKVKKQCQLLIQRYAPKRKQNFLASKTVLVKHYKTFDKCIERATKFFLKKKIARKVVIKELERID